MLPNLGWLISASPPGESRFPRHFADGTVFLAAREVLPGWSMARNRWITIRPNGERIEFSFAHRIYSGAELEGLVGRAGLKPLAVYGALDGRPYDRNATRLVIVAQT